MTVVRSRHNEKLYKTYSAKRCGKGCDFCSIAKGDPQFVAETMSFKVIRNKFPYVFWDDQAVEEHLMVVPKQHAESLASFTLEQAVEYLKLISDHEMNGYHAYVRAVKSISRSIFHQHTHLIKGMGKPKKIVLQVEKPHILFMR